MYVLRITEVLTGTEVLIEYNGGDCDCHITWDKNLPNNRDFFDVFEFDRADGSVLKIVCAKDNVREAPRMRVYRHLDEHSPSDSQYNDQVFCERCAMRADPSTVWVELQTVAELMPDFVDPRL